MSIKIDKYLGRSKGNAGSDSGLELQKCNPCDSKTQCFDEGTLTAAGDTIVRGVIIDGEEKLFDKPYRLDDPALPAALDAAVGHYEMSEKYVCASYEGGAFNYQHVGYHRVGDLTGEDGTPLGATVTSKCNIGKECTYQVNLPASLANAPTLKVADSEGTEVVNDTLVGDYSTVTQPNADALAGEIQGFIPNSTVTAEAVEGTHYVVTIVVDGEYDITLADKNALNCGCIAVYVA